MIGLDTNVLVRYLTQDDQAQAKNAYRAGPADFADYVIGAANRHAGCTETVTFNRQLRRAAGFRVL